LPNFFEPPRDGQMPANSPPRRKHITHIASHIIPHIMPHITGRLG